MKFLRIVPLIALAVALTAGFVSTTEAAVLDKVTVLSPESGVIRGIDSLIVAQLEFRTTHTDSDSVVAYLWLGTGDTLEVADGSREAWAANISIAQGDTTAAGAPKNATNAYVSARVPVKTSTWLTAGAIDTSATKLGDIDSVAIAGAPVNGIPTWTATVWLKIGADVGTVSAVNVYGAVYDEGAKDAAAGKDGYTNVLVGKTADAAAWSTTVDGDRPSQSTLQKPVVTGLGAKYITGYAKLAGTQPVLNVGDSIQVGYDLGSAGDDIILLGDVSLSATLELGGKTHAINLGSITTKVGNAYVVVAEGMFDDTSAPEDTSGVVSLFMTDAAGNLSSPNVDDAVPAGLTASANFVVDAKAPVLDSAAGDTIIPANNDTITDGGMRTAYEDDRNPLVYNLGEALASLTFTFDSETDANDRTFTITAADSGTATDPYVFTDVALSAGVSRNIDLTAAADDSTAPMIYNAGTAVAALGKIPGLATGTYTVKAVGTDLAGNAGTELARTGVYIDVDDVVLGDRFPTKLAFGPTTAARTDTIEESTSIVTFQLSEPTDSTIIVYTKLTGADTKAQRTRRLAGSELTSSLVQAITVDSLTHGTQYALTILARDLAGNYTKVGPDTFLYDTSFVVPLIKRFVIDSSVKGYGTPALAGDEITLTVVADATMDGTRDAVTYKQPAVIKVEGGGAVTLTGTGVTDLGGGRATLSADQWLAGKRTLKLKNTAAIDTLSITVVDSTDADNPYVGTADSVIVYNPAAYTQIVVGAPTSVGQGEVFTIDLTLADQFGNRRVADDRYVALSANKVGVDLPEGDILINDGMAQVTAVANGYAGADLIIRAADIVDINSGAATIRAGATGAMTVVAGGAAVDAPDTLIAADYLGANGAGDQGGFVALTWDLSDDHAGLTGYRIYREMMVDYRVGGELEDAIVMLDEPANAWVPWGIVDAVPGETIGRAIVATLDNVATRWAIAAEMAGSTSGVAKEAFDGVADVSSAYELMASTMVESKQAAEIVDGPVFATLTPEALAFVETGLVPQMKTVDALVRSNLTPTVEAVAAVDNIAPEAVSILMAKDTPSDAGSSVTLTWTLSESDVLYTRSVPNAVGSSLLSDQVQGVQGYNVYRAFDGEFALVGKAQAGQSSFADVTALNGVRYTYEVRPFDADNETASVQRTAMAIRNNVVDASGAPIHGLFGMDNAVGFDDFFLFADNFGMTAADAAFEPAFDMVPNARVDFEDFFLFADSFGKVANVAGKVIPGMAGLNTDARLYLDAGSELPAIGDEIAIRVDLADYAEMKGYGLNVSFDAEVLEFVGVTSEDGLLGGGDFANAQVISESEGEIAVAAYGETVTEGELDLNLVFRTRTEIENTYVEVTESEVRDGNYAVNQVALPAPVQIQTRPEAFALANNYPNPFNPATTIKYALPEAAFVTLEVYNVVGQVVSTLVADQQNAGRYVVQWDATNDSGHSLSSGIYFYRLQAGGEFLEVKKMLLLK